MQASTSRVQIGQWTIRICLVIQLTSIATLAVLNLLDERLESASLSSLLLGKPVLTASSYTVLLTIVAHSLLISLIVFAATVLIGQRAQRNLWNLLFLTTMIAVTLALFTNWQRISWEGRRYRMHSRIASLQTVCDALQKDWPSNDMDHALLGPIMAYPQWNPSTLILLTPKPVDERFSLAAIDRAVGRAEGEDVFRFELSSGYETIWLEHRNDSGLDNKFTNGIEQNFTRQYFISLSPEWYLVRYQ